MTEYPKATYVGKYVDDSFKLAKFFRVLRKRWIVIVAVSVSVFAGNTYYTFTRTPQYRSTSSLLVNSTIAISDIQLPGLSTSSLVNLSTEVAILESRPLIEIAVSKMQQSPSSVSYKDIDPLTIMNGLDIRPEKDTMVLRLTYTDSDPKRAREVLNALTQTYVEYSLKDRRTKSSTAIKFIQDKLPQVKQQLDKSALAVTQFRKTYNIVDPDTYAASVYKMREALEKQAQELQIKIAQVQQQYEALSRQVGKSPEAAISSAILQQDTPYQSLVKQFQEVETNYFLERTRFREDHPTVIALRDRRDELYRLLETRAQSVVGVRGSTTNIANEPNSAIQQNLASQLFDAQTNLAVSQAQLESIRNAQTEVATAFSKIPQIQQRYVEIQRQLALDTSTYNKLSEKLEELRISEAQEISSWKILEPPLIPIKPSSPDIERSLITGAISGIALGILFALLLNRLDQRIREVEELREMIDIPLLASIPMTEVASLVPTNSQGILPSSSYYAFKEALGSLALNLRYLGTDDTMKVIAFTSSVPSEGKSTLTYNLANILAALGHRVLLVDADMRKPTIHKLAKLGNKVGLSTALATLSSWQDLIQAGDELGNLHVLTSGSLPPNPMLLLESSKMAALLQEWRQEYDYVLVDTPPVIGITDAQCLTSKVDTFILVAAINRSTRSGISRALEILSTARANVSGLLINMIGSSDSEYHYGYYNHYYLNASEAEEQESDAEVEVIEN
ncbi:polysaccharide biosynthesis tyrosine autokinase [Pseudanabaena galeata UHCC 0370]|jgi:polysaccharide biosynthesis transport protein|uniref:non-specific protein-tyrosine kinase n=1 Tax=Pseudanabaena galeata UHCC 0370 TaxID=3110310 RepID=A0ABU5TL01_9CYAN|nr:MULTISPECIES: polysaccharide biosynthesis tyrosine autokinase [Pseudanabaena]MEA5478976.1 polysaccharide biosynthesis tyrosine autokinase [Pseudanabaena galeata UHCC 0370]MEA5485818.1 polysaccharide biosynthesis tyrosine autokinase [Pseudanabaena sp. CCNP1317]WGS72291.1 polysaccharide biosynthesis tyrosine autokinase [Pseudanabaena galeata CCNP1313]